MQSVSDLCVMVGLLTNLDTPLTGDARHGFLKLPNLSPERKTNTDEMAPRRLLPQGAHAARQ